eukprot:13909457-Alexandrium_andersonii.AAC.1
MPTVKRTWRRAAANSDITTALSSSERAATRVSKRRAPCATPRRWRANRAKPPQAQSGARKPVSYTHLRAHETSAHL